MPDYLKLKKTNCKNCYKCIRHCPVKSIQFSENQANILRDACILCGQCFVVCPQNAKEIRNDVHLAKALIKSGAPVYASIAPSFVANYDDVTIASMEEALLKLGFSGAEETAIGAAIVKKEYDRLVQEGRQDVIISSCCHTVNLLIQRYYPEAAPLLAQMVSPMEAHCRDMKRRVPDAKTVFIGPCISKKAEVESCGGAVDCALTFEELSEWLKEERVVLARKEDKSEKGLTRFFPTSGGILRSMAKENPAYAYMAVDGIENCIRSIKDVLRGKAGKCFIEMSACAGSCIGGPVMDKDHALPVREYIAVARYAKEKDFDVHAYANADLGKAIAPAAMRKIRFGHQALEEVLRKMGKTRPEQELNCGSCGYNTCREKAEAVLEGKADLSMCLPYLKDRAESFSDIIVSNSPNAIVVINENLEVQQINAAACRLLHVREASDVLGDQVVKILDPTPFQEICMENVEVGAGAGAGAYNRRVYLAEYQKYVDQTIIRDKSYHILICIMRDVTEKAVQKAAKEGFNRKAIELTDRVIEKQMRAVQEIASLLGETTAETKVALTKLKESLSDE